MLIWQLDNARWTVLHYNILFQVLKNDQRYFFGRSQNRYGLRECRETQNPRRLLMESEQLQLAQSRSAMSFSELALLGKPDLTNRYFSSPRYFAPTPRLTPFMITSWPEPLEESAIQHNARETSVRKAENEIRTNIRY